MKPFILHAGMSKSGTATLQRAIFLNHSEVYYLGKDNRSDLPRGYVSSQVQAVLEPLLWNKLPPIHTRALRQFYHDEIYAKADDEQVIIASWESLGSVGTRRFRAVLNRLGLVVDDMKLLICLRNPLSWIGSQYLQELYGQYSKNNWNRYFGGRPYISLEEWLRAHTRWRGLKGWLSSAENIKSAVSRIGRDNVGVFLFEELCQKPEDYYRGIADFLCIGTAEVLELASDLQYNARLLDSEFEFIKSVDASKDTRAKWYDQTMGERLMDLKNYSNSDQENLAPAKIELDETWREKVSQATRKDNEWLEQEFGLNLKQYGYSL